MVEDDEPDPWFRPVWDDEPAETEGPLDLRPPPPLPRSLGHPRPVPGTDPALLAVLADAADAWARLDALAAVAPEPVRTGLTTRLTLHEAAGVEEGKAGRGLKPSKSRTRCRRSPSPRS